LADVEAILVESHRFSGITVDLGAATLDLSVPRMCRARLRFAVQATDQLERQARTFVRREAKNVCKNVGRSHAKHITNFRQSWLPARLGGGIDGHLPAREYEDSRVATQRTGKNLGPFDAKTDAIVFDRG
jgi:hypothetical protein